MPPTPEAHTFECLAIREWHWLRKTRRCSFAGIGATFLKEAHFWGWPWGFKRPSQVQGLSLPFAWVSGHRTPIYFSSTLSATILPAVITKDQTSETVGKSHLNAFFYKSCWLWCLFTAREQRLRHPLVQAVSVPPKFMSQDPIRWPLKVWSLRNNSV